MLDVGFMFDAHHFRTTKSIMFENGNSEIFLRCIDEEPGHVQSGQHLWPGAYLLSKYCTSLCNLFDQYLA